MPCTGASRDCEREERAEVLHLPGQILRDLTSMNQPVVRKIAAKIAMQSCIPTGDGRKEPVRGTER